MKRHPSPEGVQRVAALQLDESFLQLAVLENDGQQSVVHVDSMQWRSEKLTYSDESVESLGDAFRTMAAKWNLGGLPLSLCLSGDLCVTRVVVGRTEEVESELSDLVSRCGLYLSLGPGRKIISSSVREVDVRRDHGLAAVVNERLLILLAKALSGTSLQIASIEPSAVGLCRFVGQQSFDKSEPVLILNTTQRGSELCLSHDGHLYLNYRPAIHRDQHKVASLVLHHRVRINRYCRRLSLPEDGIGSKIYVAGQRDAIAATQQAFASYPSVQTCRVERVAENCHWSCSDESAVPEFAALIGTCLHRNSTTEPLASPDLLPELTIRQRIGWREKLRPWLATAITTLLLIACFQGLAWNQSRVVGSLQEETRPLVHAQEIQRERFEQLTKVRMELGHFQALKAGLAQPEFTSIVHQIAQCLAPPMRLYSMQFDETGVTHLQGYAETEASVYEFLGWLEKLPFFASAALQGTHPVEGHNRNGISFDIECRLVTPGDFKAEGPDNAIH